MDRDTDDLDFFTKPGSGIHPAAEALSKWCAAEGLACRHLRQEEWLVQMEMSGPDGSSTLVDLAEDTGPRMLTGTPLGPEPTTEEAAVRKLLALFGRMAARDFADVYDLSKLVSKEGMLTGAHEMDRGFQSD